MASHCNPTCEMRIFRPSSQGAVGRLEKVGWEWMEEVVGWEWMETGGDGREWMEAGGDGREWMEEMVGSGWRR
ncbi:hypothetical protein Pmani_035963 [Petrolisthes manimaculis]|uniref:Uncharacterized protein n=1 Tax=Petrolisthes manimaculis TaxID=1843537 RepID=A0AAE1NJG0_9EUCA|nr:hypothetical protein Pmani_035963 [Petrolisthes manimaculis]